MIPDDTAEYDYSDFTECWNCGGLGVTPGCFEDCCSGSDCDPDDAENCCAPNRCDVCNGKGGWITVVDTGDELHQVLGEALAKGPEK